MHQYLRSIGFGAYKTKKELEAVLKAIIENPDDKLLVEQEQGTVFAQLECRYGEDFGIAVCGEYDEDGNFDMEYYVPFFQGYDITTYETPIVERHAAKESYSGLCDDFRVGISIIFYVSNVVEYKRALAGQSIDRGIHGVKLTGMSTRGTILMPLAKTESQRMADIEASIQRGQLISAAKKGDEQAIESLTLEDLDTFSMVGRRINKEDVLTIVESYFMPRGIECDQYSILGEIKDYRLVENTWTKEKVYVIMVNCNELYFDVCINQQDLYGVPEIGRRLKADIWLQGQIAYEI